ncbi:T9SS C-terminal target domain-containing protein, partial [bacterium]
IEGQLVDTIEARYGTAGWDASSLPSGFYFYQLKTENYNEVKKMIFIK